MNIKHKIKEKLTKFATASSNRKMLKTKMPENRLTEQPTKKFKKVLLNWIHRILCVTFRAYFILINGRHGKKMPPINDLLLTESASSLALKIRTKKITSVQTMNSFITRIKEINPSLNCVVDERFENALEDAADVDKLISSGKFTAEELAKDKPFLGVPISTKDCIMVKDLICTSGLTRRRNIRAEEDADAIALMRKAGAIPFALTNVSECCMWWESFNKVHGRSKNPYDDNRIVGGSSGGEGCIQAAAGSPFGIGSDIGGSIRMPAFFNGVFGHKPSKFIVSNDGQYPKPISKEQNSFLGVGPICRFATDLKPMLQILADKNATSLYLDEPVDLRNVHFYYQEDDCGGNLVSPVDPDIRLSIQKVIKHLKNTVNAKVTKVNMTRLRKSHQIWFANMKQPDAVDFDVQLANLDEKINVWLELLKLLIGRSQHTFVALMTCIAEKNGIKYGSEKYAHFVEERKKLYQEFKEMLGSDGVFLYPVHPTVAPYHSEPIIRALNFSYTGVFNILGFPCTSIPLGLGIQGLPLGIQAVAGLNQDRLNLAVACELERAFGGWVPPDILA